MPALVFLRVTGHANVFWYIFAWGAAAAVGAAVGPLQARVVPSLSGAWGWVSRHRDLGPRYLAEGASFSAATQLRTYGIGLILGLAAVGIVQAVGTLMGPITILFLGMSLVAIPEAARVLHRSPRRLPLFCVLISGGLAAAAFAWGVVLLVVLPTGFGGWLLGPIWRPTYPLLLPQTLFAIGAGVGVGAGAGLHALGAARRSLRAMILTSAVYLVLGLVGAVVAGAAGTVSGTAVASWIGTLVVWWQLRAALRESGHAFVGDLFWSRRTLGSHARKRGLELLGRRRGQRDIDMRPAAAPSGVSAPSVQHQAAFSEKADCDAEQEMRAGQDADTAPYDLTVIHQRTAGARASQVMGPLAGGAASDQVVVGNIPQQPSGFQPLTDLLAELEQAGGGVPMVHVVVGMHGVGKTQLAAGYARTRLAAGWRLVAWINAENTGILLAGLVAVADAAGVSEVGTRQDAAAEGRAVRRWLEDDGDRRLLVFDGATDPDALRPFVPTCGTAQVLITSNRQSVANLGTSLSMDPLSADEALEFLTERSGLDEVGAVAVAAELGYLPLALAQAAAVIEGQHLEYGTYLEWLRALPLEENLIGEDGQLYPRGVAQAALLSLEAVRASDQVGACARVMEIMAVLSATGVRRELLYAAGRAGALANGGYGVAAAIVDRALQQLASWSLLTFSLDGQTVIAHRLVTQVVRDSLARRGRLSAVCRSAASILEARAQALAGSQDRSAIRDIPAQVSALTKNAGLAREAYGELATALLRLRFLALYHLIELGDSAPQAIAVGEPLTADLAQVLGSNHPDTLNSRNSLAAAYQAVGRTDEAILLFEKTLVSRERLLGPDHPDTLTSQNNLAAAYQDEGRVSDAILLFELTLAARERLLGPDHPSTLNSRGNLAAALRDAGRVAEAVSLLERILAARERLLGPDHLGTLASRDNLAAAYRDAGRSAEAIPLLKQTLAARERLMGVDHPDTLTARNNLALSYREASRAG